MTTRIAAPLRTFGAMLDEQRWDDHRFYHHSLANQSLHFLSATTFMVAYLLAFRDLALASLLGWCVAMTSRQAGHFFFEPKEYDAINQATHAHKEEVKVGYNLARKYVFMAIWAASPLLLLARPDLFGLVERRPGWIGFARNLGFLWLMVGVGGLLFRTVQLFVVRDVPTGLVWATKILTDPFNDFRLYRAAPLRLLRGERMDAAVAIRS